jgi:hypothetical protein
VCAIRSLVRFTATTPVFLYCRGAIDALPGAKQDIFAALSDRDEAKLLDDLMLRAGHYLHRGRHIALEGDEHGQFRSAVPT